MGDTAVLDATKPTRAGSGGQVKLQAGPVELTVEQLAFDASGTLTNTLIYEKWIYVFDSDAKSVYAEIFAEAPDTWKVKYKPKSFSGDFKHDNVRKGTVVINKATFDKKGYRLFLSPVRASQRAIDLLLSKLEALSQVEPPNPPPAIMDGAYYATATDYYLYAEAVHKHGFLPALEKWEAYVNNAERQGKLFIASVLKNWKADGDPADIEDDLKTSDGPEKFIEAYAKEEQRYREAAEAAQVALARLVDHPAHQAVELSAIDGGPQGLACGLLHWGIVSQCMLRTAPGRVLAYKLIKENQSVPAAVVFADSQNPDLPTAFNTYKKAHIAGLFALTELLAAKVKHLHDAAGPGLSIAEKVKQYLKNLSIETDLKGTHKLIFERLEAGDKITKHLKGPKRSQVITAYQKLAAKADAAIPTFDAKATQQLESAERFKFAGDATEAVGKTVLLVMEMTSLMSAIEEYRNADPNAKTQKLISLIGAGGDFYGAVADIMEKFSARATFLRISGGAAGFVSGIIDMLDAEEKAVKAAMNNNDYAAAAGHAITAVGASLTVIAAGALLAKGISGGAVFGGPFGAIVGAIGAALMALGMLIVSYFSDNDYETFAKHCFFGEDHGTTVTPDWSTVSFGGGSIQNEVTALYDLLYRYKVQVFYEVATFRGLPNDTYETTGITLKITLGYANTGASKFMISLETTPKERELRRGSFVSGLRLLPDAETEVSTDPKTGVTSYARHWPLNEVFGWDLAAHEEAKRRFPKVPGMYKHPTDFKYSVQLIENGKHVGKPSEGRGVMGGLSKFGHIKTGGYDGVEFTTRMPKRPMP